MGKVLCFVEGCVMRFFTYYPASLHFIFIRCCYNSENEVDEIKPSEKNNTHKIQHRPRTHGVDDLKKKKVQGTSSQFSLKWKLSVLAVISGRLRLEEELQYGSSLPHPDQNYVSIL